MCTCVRSRVCLVGLEYGLILHTKQQQEAKTNVLAIYTVLKELVLSAIHSKW